MDRGNLIDLFRNGMQYPVGKHRFYISRCFEITVRSDSVIEMDEYEGFSTQSLQPLEPDAPSDNGGLPHELPKEMFHLGRSILNLKDGSVVEEEGKGWFDRLKKPSVIPK